MDSDTFKAIQILALDAAEKETFESFYRRICRWYSRTFSTPLNIVEEMDEESVLQTYFEETFYDLKNSHDEAAKEQYQRIKENLMHNKAEDSQAEEEDDAWVSEMLSEIKKTEAVTDTSTDKKAQQKPNLIDENINVFKGGEDSLPDFDPEME